MKEETIIISGNPELLRTLVLGNDKAVHMRRIGLITINLAHQLRKRLSPDFDLWYETPFEDKSDTISRKILIYYYKMINEITSDNRSMKAKEYMFHVDLIHLETYYEDWYEEFPVLLTDEEFDELCKAQRKWMQTEEWINRHSDADEECFLKKYCPQIYPKVKTSLEKFALSKYGEGIIKELYNADIYIPGDVWDVNRGIDCEL